MMILKLTAIVIADFFTYPNFMRIMELLHFVSNLVKKYDCEDIMLGMVGVCVWRSGVQFILAPFLSGNLPELNLTASEKPILIKFQDVNSVPIGSTPQCVSFDLQGSPLFSNVVSENVCSTIKQGYFSIVIASVAPSPTLVTQSPPEPKIGGGGGKKNNRKQMEKTSEVGEALHMISIRVTRAPTATGTRTQLVLEHEYVP
ncbi:hypothetical protein MKX01_006394 [Papaver californicum]|nr:hypothetical protein MKX01_006394 [Papaver californicum]